MLRRQFIFASPSLHFSKSTSSLFSFLNSKRFFSTATATTTTVPPPPTTTTNRTTAAKFISVSSSLYTPRATTSTTTTTTTTKNKFGKQDQDQDQEQQQQTHLSEVDFRWAHTKETLQTLGNVTKNYTVHPYQNTGDAYRDMWEAVDKAKHYIIWHTYIAKDDMIGQQTIEKLRQAAERGVKVEYLYDCGGNMTGRSKMVEPLTKLPNATVIRYRPFFPQHRTYFIQNLMTDWKKSPGVRNHRKILVVDDEVGFTGGLNIGNEYAGTKVGGTGRFRDSHCRITGEEGVKMLKAACEDTIKPQEDYGLGRAWMKMLRWRQWAEMTVRFRRAAAAAAKNDGNANNSSSTSSSRRRSSSQQQQNQQSNQMFRAFYETHRERLRQLLDDDTTSHTLNNNTVNKRQKLRTRLRERMKRGIVLNNPQNQSSIRSAWKKIKAQFEAENRRKLANMMQRASTSASATGDTASSSKTRNMARLSSFLKTRGKLMKKNASSLISLMEGKRRQLVLSFAAQQKATSSSDDDTNTTNTNNNNKKRSLRNLPKREEFAARFQDIYISGKDKIKESIALQQKLLAERKRNFFLPPPADDVSSSVLSSSSSSKQQQSSEEQKVKLITPSELPTKSVVIDEDDIDSDHFHDVKNSNYIVVAVPDKNNIIHNLAINRKADCFAQVLVCNPLTENFSLQMALWFVVRRAASRLWVTTPYFIPHRKLMNATIEAAKRGVDVRVITGSKQTTDPWLMWYAQQYITHRLLKAGVRLYEYHGNVEHEENIYTSKNKNKNKNDNNDNEEEENKKKTTSTEGAPVKQVMHAKTVVVDGVWSSVGSYNWDILSNKLMEASVTTLDPSVASEMEQHFENDLVKCEEIKEDTFLQRPLRVRIMCRVLYFGIKLTEYLSFRGYEHPDVTSKID